MRHFLLAVAERFAEGQHVQSVIELFGVERIVRFGRTLERLFVHLIVLFKYREPVADAAAEVAGDRPAVGICRILCGRFAHAGEIVPATDLFRRLAGGNQHRVNHCRQQRHHHNDNHQLNKRKFLHDFIFPPVPDLIFPLCPERVRIFGGIADTLTTGIRNLMISRHFGMSIYKKHVHSSISAVTVGIQWSDARA